VALVAIVGRPNVGKSTLFNRLAGRRIAIVDDRPGVTRDRNYTEVEWEGRAFTLVDTGGFETGEGLAAGVRAQVDAALAEADAIVFVLDGREGLNPLDEEMMRRLRGSSKLVFVAVNKLDSPRVADEILPEFYVLGAERLHAVSGSHGLGVDELIDDIMAALPGRVVPPEEELPEEELPGEVSPEEARETRVAVVGRPNVGKSSLVNKVLGYERVVVSPEPGTTRDTVDTRVHFRGRDYVLIDTAGIRRRGRVTERVEHVSLLRALKAMDRAEVCLLMLDAAEGITDQDAKIASHANETGRAVVVCLNKWDLVKLKGKQVDEYLAKVRHGLRFLGDVPIVPMSAVTGEGIEAAFDVTGRVSDQYGRQVTTGLLNRAIEAATEAHPPPSYRGHRIKLYYATQVGTRPPRFLIFANYPAGLTETYRRYLANQLRERLGLTLVPVQLLFRARRKER